MLGSAADVCKAAMIATEQAQQTHSPEPLQAQLLLQIHDELVWEVPDQQLAQFKGECLGGATVRGWMKASQAL